MLVHACTSLKPLPADAGSLLAKYIRNERPRTEFAEIFLASLPPPRPLAGCGTSSSSVFLKKPGLGAPGRGAHSFRHTAATLMVCNGEPLHLHEGGDRLIQSAFEYERNRSLAMNEGGLREGLVEGDLGAHRL